MRSGTTRLLTFVYIFVFAAAGTSAQALRHGASGPADDPPLDGPPAPVPPATFTRDAEGRVTLRALPLASAFTLDGRLDEEFYQTVMPVSDFVQQEPEEGGLATEKTEAWVFFDDDHLYVAARLWESAPERRVMSDMRRDSFNLYNNDHFAVMIDTFYDRRNGYTFYANAQGGMSDALITNESPNNNWNGLWDVRASTFEQGWTIEFRIPFRSVRFKEGGTVWGINLRRMVRWRNEVSFLTPIPASYNRRGLVMTSFAGSLVGLRTPANLRNIDVKPYLLGSALTDHTAVPPFSNRGDAQFGVDARWAITQEFVADLTYNTDFAQVEDDEQQVNLTRFSLFFPEKREFFLEGQEVFTFGGANTRGGGGGGGGGGGFGPNNTPILFFSRRIGLAAGTAVPIVAGGRLLGRTGPYQIGAIAMRTDSVTDYGVPATEFSVFRMNRDVLRRSRIGVLATRRAPQSGSDNHAFGADAEFNLTDTVSINAYLANTDTPGRNGDDTSYRARYQWNADRYGLQLEHLFVGEDFNPEAGFLRRQAFRRNYAQARFSPRPRAWDAVRKLTYEVSLDYTTDPGGALETREAQAQFRMELESGDQWNLEHTRSFEGLTKGFEVATGILIPSGAYSFEQTRTSYNFGPQRPISGWLNLSHGTFFGGHLTEVSWRGRAELTSRFYVEPNISWNRFDGFWGEGTTQLVSSRITYTLSPRMFAGALVQYQSNGSSVSTNVRFRWEYLPGSELFVVYSDGRSTLTRGFPTLQNRSFVVKATRLFRW
ncbi:MAG TPA: DUF5916 domain-containing protein [Vicinamibacterales bacterium]|nr:DUF5916 domain-containing protein [Vicinamibacterales bacterium]